MTTARHIHLTGICGTAMASLAGLLQLQGHRITGSDSAAYPPMSDLLRSLGIPILEPYAESNLIPAPDLVVIGNALSRGNPEIEYILDKRIPFTSMSALLAANRSSSPARTARPPPPACSPGFIRSRHVKIRRSSLPSSSEA
jgi:UDP-N-acetylmuramate: L-alanyl-gamma-D-glutamyl-meso-diaminopimelate ligase